MRTVSGLTIAALALCTLPAHAETMTPEQMGRMIQALQSRVEALEDRSRRERADAASARAELRDLKASRSSRAVRLAPVPAGPVAVADAAPITAPIVVEAPRSSFDGLYAAAIGGYQFGTRDSERPDFFANADVRAVAGGTIGAAFGYNATLGNMLVGLEGRFRKHFQEDRIVYEGESPFSSSYVRTADRISRHYGGDVSARVGLAWGETLLYTRIGAGADLLSRYFVTFGGFSNTLAPDARTKDAVSPYAIFGLGVERNFGPWFARVEGAFLTHFPEAGTASTRIVPDTYYSTEVTGAVGYRF